MISIAYLFEIDQFIRPVKTLISNQQELDAEADILNKLNKVSPTIAKQILAKRKQQNKVVQRN